MIAIHIRTRKLFRFVALPVGIVFLAISAVCIVVQVQNVTRRHAIANEIEAVGGVVERDAFGRVTEVYLIRMRNADRFIALLSELPRLNRISLESSEFSEDALRHLLGLKRLESLNLKWTPISDEGLRHVGEIAGLRELLLLKSIPPEGSPNVSPGQLSDEGLAHLAGLRELEVLIFWGADITDDGLRHLANCENLRNLWLTDTRIDGSGLHHLGKLRQLQQLDLCGTQVTVDRLQFLSGLENMRSLSVARTRVTVEEAAEAEAYFANAHPDFWIGY